MSEETGFSGYAVVDLFGHVKVAGQIREWTIAGAPFVRMVK